MRGIIIFSIYYLNKINSLTNHQKEIDRKDLERILEIIRLELNLQTRGNKFPLATQVVLYFIIQNTIFQKEEHRLEEIAQFIDLEPKKGRDDGRKSLEYWKKIISNEINRIIKNQKNTKIHSTNSFEFYKKRKGKNTVYSLKMNWDAISERIKKEIDAFVSRFFKKDSRNDKINQKAILFENKPKTIIIKCYSPHPDWLIMVNKVVKGLNTFLDIGGGETMIDIVEDSIFQYFESNETFISQVGIIKTMFSSNESKKAFFKKLEETQKKSEINSINTSPKTFEILKAGLYMESFNIKNKEIINVFYKMKEAYAPLKDHIEVEVEPEKYRIKIAPIDQKGAEIFGFLFFLRYFPDF